jgi:ketosteroid isomerase-like protein
MSGPRESPDVRVVREMYEAFNRGDYETSTAMLHDDVELHQGRRSSTPTHISGGRSSCVA